MTQFRTVNGVVAWFDTDGNPINPDGSPRSGDTLAALGGPDGSSGFAPAPPDVPPPIVVAPPAPAPIELPHPALPGGFHNLNFLVRASRGGPVVDAHVIIGRDYGNGQNRQSDGNGFANFGVLNEPALDWEVVAPGFNPSIGQVTIAGADVDLPVTLYETSAAPAPPPPPVPVPAPAPPQPGTHTFYDLNFRVSDAAGQAVYNATVTLDQDFGNGATRTTDGYGFCDFGVYAGATIAWRVDAAGFATSTGVVTASVGGLEVPVTLVAGVGAPPHGTTAPPGQISPLTPVDSGLAGTPPAPGHAAVQLETRNGVPSFTAQSFGALDVGAFGPSPVGIFVGIVSSLLGLFGSNSGGGDISRLATVLQNTGQLLLQTVQVVADLTARSVHTDTQTGGLFDHILGGVLGPIINALASVIRGGAGDLSKLFGPVSDSLKKLLGTVKHLYDTWLKPIIRAIDITRQVLRVLEAFHLGFAATLDAQLGKLEGKLTAPMLKVISEINKTRNIVNRIVTLDGALQRVTLLQSLTKHQTCVQRAIDNAPMADVGTYPGKLPDPPPAMTLDEWRAGLLSGRSV